MATGADREQGHWKELAIPFYENDKGKAVLGAVDPMQTLGSSGRGTGLDDLARDVGARLERVLENLSRERK